MYSTKSFGTYYDHRSFLFAPYAPPKFSPNELTAGPQTKRLVTGPALSRLASGPKTTHLILAAK